MNASLQGRRATIHLPALHQAYLDAKAAHEPGTPFVFRAWQTAPRPEWHGKGCTILAKHGGVIKIDGVESPYELLPVSCLVLDA